MLTLDDGKINFHRARCCQCGVCLPSCPTDALSSEPNQAGFFDIVCHHEACIVCNLCVKVCPPNWLPNDRATEEQVRTAPGLYLAHARDERIRWMSSSGGVARTITSEVLAQGRVDAVYSLLYPESQDSTENAADHNGPRPLPERVLPTGEEVKVTWLTVAPPTEMIPCSMYRPVLWGSALGQGHKDWQRVLLVGLPCQLKGAERLLKKLLPRTKLFKVAIFCRKQKVLGHTDCIKRMMSRPDEATAQVYYRGAGWPGKSGVYAGGQPLDVDYFYNARCWTLPACHSCPDCLGAGSADLTLTDPWGIVRKQDDPAGSNLVFAWTPAGKELLAQLDSVIACKPCGADDAVRSVDFDHQVADKIRAMPYHLASETSAAGWMRGFVDALATWLAETQLRFMHPRSTPVRMQIAIMRGLRVGVGKITGWLSGKSKR